MRLPFRVAAAVLLLVALGLPAAVADDAPVRVERATGEAVSGQRLAGIADGVVTLGNEAGETRVPLDDVIEIRLPTPPDPPKAFGPSEVAVDLGSGEILFGEIRGGSEKGFTLASPLLGTVFVTLDHVADIRFLRRLSQLPEAPDLHAHEESDVVHLAGDRIACTVQSFSDKAVTVETTNGEKVPVAYERIMALRVMTDPPKTPKGTLLVAVLRDGSQVIGSGPTVKDGRLRMKSVCGFSVDAAVADVVAAHAISDRFVYLSDLAPQSKEVTPFWKTVAGDPNVLYAPRMDASFAGRALRSGGRSWVKGIGAYSGTTMTWDLAGKFSEFRASAGIDDGAGPLGGVVFEVLVDGVSKWTSGFVRASSADGRGKPSPVEVPRIAVKGAKTLTLRVLPGDSEDPWPIADEADWLGAMLVR